MLVLVTLIYWQYQKILKFPVTSPFPGQLKFSHSPDDSLRKQLTFHNATTGFPTKWPLRNECRNSVLIMRYYKDLGSASDWLCCVGTQIWVELYVIFVLISQTSFCRETSDGVTKCCLFSHPTLMFVIHKCKAQLPTTQSAFWVNRLSVSIELYGWTTTSLKSSYKT